MPCVCIWEALKGSNERGKIGKVPHFNLDLIESGIPQRGRVEGSRIQVVKENEILTILGFVRKGCQAEANSYWLRAKRIER
jgi:hypothetical protein